MTDLPPTPWQQMHSDDIAFAAVTPRAGHSAVVYSLPHSGRYYPASFVAEARPSGSALRASEDAFVDDMVALSPELGVYGLACRYARAFCDVNRDPMELDARLIRGALPKAALSLSARVKAGFGVIARRLSADQDIYRHPLDMAEVNARIELIHRPYHDQLRALLAAAKADGKRVTLIDWHSMPGAALNAMAGTKPDIVLGNLHGASCAEALTRRVKALLEGEGLRVGLNKPFAGGYIVEHYGRPAEEIDALQIEINRAIYMDEAAMQPTDGLERLKRIFARITRALVDG